GGFGRGTQGDKRDKGDKEECAYLAFFFPISLTSLTFPISLISLVSPSPRLRVSVSPRPLSLNSPVSPVSPFSSLRSLRRVGEWDRKKTGAFSNCEKCNPPQIVVHG
ncbi:MAG: hypothetical protein SWY16_04080, partial [Cyanobacteriota bacterium]|nr:hypothetical protein [Cyanobacteriota bacterium]